MKITKHDPMLGKNVTIEVPITEKEYKEVLNRHNTGKYIQDIVPHLDVSFREYLISGISPEGWTEYIRAHNEMDELLNPKRDD